MAKQTTKARKAGKTTTKRVPAKARKAPAKAKKSATRKTAAKRRPAAPTLRTLTPYLAVGDAAGAIEWYKKVFGAKEIDRRPAAEGKLMHAELRIGDSTLYLSDIFPGADLVDPSRAGASVDLHVWSKDVDKLWKNALENGAKTTMPLDDMFWGDRYGKIIDPYGHSWALSYKSKLSKAKLEEKRVQAMKEFGMG